MFLFDDVCTLIIIKNNMPVFYTLHCLTPAAKESGCDEGQRNSRIFLIGMFFYVLIYIILKNMVFSGKLDEKLYDAIFVGLIVMFLADGFTMGFIYKNYFGRSVTNEANEIWLDGEKKFYYDEKTHTYVKKIEPAEININKIISNNKNTDIFKKSEQNKIEKISHNSNRSNKSSKSKKSTKSVKSNKGIQKLIQ